jgi:hypothetical protein
MSIGVDLLVNWWQPAVWVRAWTFRSDFRCRG